jgi:DNA-binding CsgD family transcriptional regulator
VTSEPDRWVDSLDVDMLESSRATESSGVGKSDLRCLRELWASEVLVRAHIVMVGLDESHDPIGSALRWAGCKVQCIPDVGGWPKTPPSDGARAVDGAVLSAGVRSDDSFGRLRALDPTLSVFFFGRPGAACERGRVSFASDRDATVLERPAARYEILECAATAVLKTKANRSGLAAIPPCDTTHGASPPRDRLSPPLPDLWSAAQLRGRILALRDRCGLSLRETQVLRGIVRGLTNSEIAEQLGITVHGVKKFAASLLRKLELQSRHELAWLLDRVWGEDKAVTRDG